MEPGSVIGISGFGVVHGFPVHLIAAVRDHWASGFLAWLGSVPLRRKTLSRKLSRTTQLTRETQGSGG